MPHPFHLLIVAAGSGTRLGGDLPKQYQKIGDVPLLRRTIEVFLKLIPPENIHIVISAAHSALYAQAVEGLTLLPPITGGSERNESVSNGIKALPHLKDNDILLIHDAARPFVRTEDILNLVKALSHDDTGSACVAATLAVPVADTLRRVDGANVDRKDLWAIQTPQGFHFTVVRQAHEKLKENFTDDAGMVAALGIPVKMVEGTRDNIKITTPGDMALAEDMLMCEKRTQFRSGFGFDVHSFDTSKKNVILCGIEIPCAAALSGHSDADAGLHALTDALLGTIGAGDIGSFFPPSDLQWKGADSRIFVEKALSLVREKGGRIVNADITFICEIPKIGPHRAAMQQSLGALLGLPPDRVGIKATTSEGMGFTGRKEGLAAQAIVSVEFPA